jgi:hypothetical protein
MSALVYDRVLRDAESLSREEQLLLIERLAGRLRATGEPAGARPSWEDHGGTAPFPLCGEDAQAWVSRTRQESDEGRHVR